MCYLGIFYCHKVLYIYVWKFFSLMYLRSDASILENQVIHRCDLHTKIIHDLMVQMYCFGFIRYPHIFHLRNLFVSATNIKASNKIDISRIHLDVKYCWWHDQINRSWPCNTNCTSHPNKAQNDILFLK